MIIEIFFVISMIVNIILCFAIYMLKKEPIKFSEEDEELNEQMNDNYDLLINFAERNGNILFGVPRHFEGRNLKGNCIIKGFPRDVLVKDGEISQEAYRSKKFLVKKGRLITIADNTRSSRNIHFALPTTIEELDNDELGKLLRPYLLMKETSDDVINALVKKGKKQKEMMEMLASGEIEEQIIKKINKLKSSLNIDDIARQSIKES